LIRINEAYETLTDPKRRAVYDATIGIRTPGASEDSESTLRPAIPRALLQLTATLLLLLMLPLILRIALFLFRSVWRIIAVVF
jgi:curved DNA-binding protein CbpA